MPASPSQLSKHRGAVAMSNAIAFSTACLLLLLTVLSRLARSTAWLVLAAHNIPWVIALTVWSSGVIMYNASPTSSAMILVGGVLSFNLGVLVNREQNRAVTSVRRCYYTAAVSLRAYSLLWVAYILGFLWLLLTISRYFGIGTLLTNPKSIRSYSDVNYLQVFPLPGKLLFYLAPLLMVLTANSRLVLQLRGSPRLFRASLFLVLVVSQFASLQRTNIFIGIVWSVAVAMIERAGKQAVTTEASSNAPRVARKRLAQRNSVVAAVGILGAIICFQFIGNTLGKTAGHDSRFSPYLSKSINWEPAASILIYGSSGVAAFLTLTQSPNHSWPGNLKPPIFGDYNPVTHGAATFAFAPKIAPLFTAWPEVGPFVSVPFPTNVYTWLEPWYRDFRVPGVTMVPFAVGFLITSLVRRRESSLNSQLLAALALTVLVWAPFTNRLMSTMTIELALVVAYVLRPRRIEAPGALLPTDFLRAVHGGNAGSRAEFRVEQATLELAGTADR